ncbi:hypothetical protein GCM10017083_37930 [Thalassobaculum fulvum]|uniref:ABM domain-containing protein n=1 Tax=Thalassobaculum fulvum TaxID=1633335 RepID=A0A918XVF8_9PROT|nr:antibiotic biosynthesis monooxygenase [Thalassobaculum fulvum]GHD57034.1 hypothetical protein GCM10017083_37930 [Thalassobaculum fulvum]
MTGNVHWMLEVAVKDGQLDAFRALMEEMVAATRDNEPDALNYEWAISGDGATCHIYERYRDSAAVMTHIAWFGANAAKRFLAIAEPKRLTVYGSPDEAATKALDRMGAVYMKPLGGFAR